MATTSSCFVALFLALFQVIFLRQAVQGLAVAHHPSVQQREKPSASDSFSRDREQEYRITTKFHAHSVVKNYSSNNLFDNELPHEVEERLFKKLFDEKLRHTNRVRPAFSGSAVIVRVEVVLLKLIELVEIDQEVAISGFLVMNWTDPRYSWPKEEYGNIEHVVTDPEHLWTPDISIINSDDMYMITRDSRFPVTIYSTGQILYVPAGRINARCELDASFFPFDQQLCKFRFESWVYDWFMLQIVAMGLTIHPGHFVENPQWFVKDTFTRSEVAKYEDYVFSTAEFYLLLERKSDFYLMYSVFPCAIISFLAIFSHAIPFSEPERINLGCTMMGSVSIFHLSAVTLVPKSSNSTPLLALYVDSVMCLVAVSLLECLAAITFMSNIKFSVPPPFLWYWIVEKFGDNLFLGAASYQWRRSYLNVLASLKSYHSKLALVKRHEELGWEPSSNANLRHKICRKKYVIFKDANRINSTALHRLFDKWGQYLEAKGKKRSHKGGFSRNGKNIGNEIVLVDEEDGYDFLKAENDGERVSMAAKPSKNRAKNRDDFLDLEGEFFHIEDDLGHMVSAVEKHNLRKECIGVWITFVTALDRIALVSMLLMFVAFPIYLFRFYPVPLNYAHLKQNSSQF